MKQLMLPISSNPRFCGICNNVNISIIDARSIMLHALTAENLTETIELHQQFLVQCDLETQDLPEDECIVYRVMIHALLTSLGSHLLLHALDEQDRSIQQELVSQALQQLEQGQKFDRVSGKLKLAAFYFTIGEFANAIHIVSGTLEKRTGNIVYSGSTLNKLVAQIDSDIINKALLDLPLEDVLHKLFVAEVIYLPSEITCLPKPVQYEIATAAIEMPETGNIQKRELAAFDSFAFAYFMMFMCYYQTQQEDQMLKTMIEFSEYIKSTWEYLSHTTADLNLLAHCYFMAEDVQAALDMLSISLKIEPSYELNSASWIAGAMYSELHYT